MVVSKKAVERAIGTIGSRDYRDPTIQRIARKALEKKKKKKVSEPTRTAKPSVSKSKSKSKSTPKSLAEVLKIPSPYVIKKPPKLKTSVPEKLKRPKLMMAKEEVSKLLGTIGSRDYRDPEIQRIALEASRKRKTKTKVSPKRVIPKDAVSVIYRGDNTKGVQSAQTMTPAMLETLRKTKGYTEIKKVEGRGVTQSELNKAISEDIGKIPLVGGRTALYSKSREKRTILTTPAKVGESKADLEYRINTKILEKLGYRKQAKSQLTQEKIAEGKQAVWKTPSGKLIYTKGTPPYGMSRKIAKERGFVEVKTTSVKKTDAGYVIKYGELTAPEIPEEGKGSPKAKDAVPIETALMGSQAPTDATGKGVVPLSSLMGYAPVYTKEWLSEQKEYQDKIKAEEEKRKIEAIKVGLEVFKKMKKEGTVSQLTGLVASSMRPWSTEVAGMRYAESAGSVPKGSTDKLMYQRMGEEIIDLRKEGKMSSSGYIKMLFEAPSSVTGSVLAGMGTGALLSGVSASLKGIPTGKKIFDAVMLGVGAKYVWDTGLGIWSARHIEKDEAKMWQKVVLASGEIGGLMIGGLAVEGRTLMGKKVKAGSTGALKYKEVGKKPEVTLESASKMRGDIKTAEVTLGKEPAGSTHKGKMDVVMKTSEGKNINVKMDFKGTTDPAGISHGVITVPKQTVGGIKIDPQIVIVESAEASAIINLGRPKKVTTPSTTEIIGEKVVITPETPTYIQPYTKRGVTLERKLTLTERDSGLKLDLKKKMENIDADATSFVNRYLGEDVPIRPKRKVIPTDRPTRKELLEGYDIVLDRSKIGFKEAGVIETTMGSGTKKTQLAGKTEDGFVYFIKETSKVIDKSVVDSAFSKINKNINEAYRGASSPRDAPFRKVKPTVDKVTIKKPTSVVDSVYHDVISSLSKKKPETQVAPATSPSSSVARTVQRMKIGGKKPSSAVDSAYRDIVANMNQQSSVKRTKTELTKRNTFDVMMREMKNSMRIVLDTTKGKSLIRSEKTPIDKFKGRELVVRPKGDIILVKPVKGLVPIDKIYKDLVKYVDPRPPAPKIPRPPKPRPPEPKPKPKPDKLEHGFPLIAIPGVPMGLGLGYSVDNQYRTLTRFVKHDIPNIEELFKW